MDELKALVESLRADAEWLEGVAEGQDDARIVAHLRAAADALSASRDAAEDAKADAVRLHADKMRLHTAILWALGEWDDFPPREEREGPFWWRRELRERAGIKFIPPIEASAHE